jgi:hypothetical protein
MQIGVRLTRAIEIHVEEKKAKGKKVPVLN